MGGRPAATPAARDPSGPLVLADISAWIEFLRGTGSTACVQVRARLDGGLAVTEMVRMEVLAGARDEGRAASLSRLLLRATLLPTEAGDYDEAAALYRTCRRNAYTPRSTVDCLIAVVAIRNGAQVLHNDAGYATIAKCSPLQQTTG